MKYKLTVAYDGSFFSGWQVQKNAVTVQGEMTRCVRQIFGDGASVTGSSRTDSGVHAVGFVCHITAEGNSLSPQNTAQALNSLLSPHIFVISCEEADENFHARYSALSKEYRYLICDGGIRDPFLYNRAWFYPRRLDEEKMNRAAKDFLGTFDFRSFMAQGSKVTDTHRTVYSAQVQRCDGKIEFSVCANGFLYNMVRIMTGTLVDISCGKINESVRDIIACKSRSHAGITAPAQGLYLYRVNY